MKTHFLSQDEREFGRKNYFSFSILNGLGFGFLADTTIYLLAIYFNASNMQLGYISSLIYLSGIFLVITPKLFSGKNLITIFFWAWFLRGVVCLINAAVLFVSNQIAIAIILTTYTFFCIFRIIGTSLTNPVVQMVSTSSNLGNVLTHSNAYTNLGSILGRIISFIIVSISYMKGLAGLMVLQGAGFIFNTIASSFIKKIPCREKIEENSGQNIFMLLLKNIKYKNKLLPMIFYWNFLSLTVFIGFTIPLLKKIMGLEQNIVFLYTIIIAVSTTISMYMTKPFIDRVSTKPFIIITSLCDMIFFLAWAFVKPSTSLHLVFLLGFISMFSKGINQSVIAKALVFSIPNQNKVTYNSMVNFIAGIFTLIFGFLAGASADIGEKIHPQFFNSYYILFLIAVVISSVSFIFGFFINEKREKDFIGASASYFSFQNLRSLIDIYYLDMTKDPEKRLSILMSLKYRSSPFALSEMHRILKNPLSTETEEVLKSLFVKPRSSLLSDILAIAKDRGSYHRATAIFALGAYPAAEVEKALIKFLSDKEPRIKSNASKSLSRIGNRKYLDKIIRLAKDKKNSVWDLMNYIIAITVADKNSIYLKNIFNAANSQNDKSFKETIFSLFSRMLEFSPELNIVYQKENLERLSGLKFLLDEARQIDLFYRNSNFIIESFSKAEYLKIWDIIVPAIKIQKHKKPFIYIFESIKSFNKERIDRTNAIALLYFSFFILLANED